MGGVLARPQKPSAIQIALSAARATAPHRAFAIVRDFIGRQLRSRLLPPPRRWQLVSDKRPENKA
jgi:hypothetical protein